MSGGGAPFGPAFEAFLARLYTDASFRDAFLAAPRQSAAGLHPAEIAALEAIDREGLQATAVSFAAKRARHIHQRTKGREGR